MTPSRRIGLTFTGRLGRLHLVLAVGLVLAVLATLRGPASSQGLSSIKTVFVILFENTDWSQLTSSTAPYIRNTLVPRGAHAEQYFTPPGNHPSEPNYIWLEAGDHLGLTTDHDASASNSTSTTDHLVRYLEDAGVTWKTYQEDIDGLSCPLSSSGLYAAKHNPFVFFQDITDHGSPSSAHCIAHNRPYAELTTDLQQRTVARYNVITPNLCHDMHDCGIAAGDTWLRNNLPAILNSQAYTDNGAVFLVWDEGAHGSDGPIPMIVLSPLAKVNYSNSIAYTHSSMLRTMQTIFGVGPPTHAFLRDAANAMDLSDLFATATPGPTRSGEGAAPSAELPPVPKSAESPERPAPRPSEPPRQSQPPPESVPSKPATAPTATTLDLAGLEKRLRDTKAIGVFTKLALKNQVDDLLEKFREFHRSPDQGMLTKLREAFDLLLLKVLSLLQDGDPVLARDIASSREALWNLLIDPDTFKSP